MFVVLLSSSDPFGFPNRFRLYVVVRSPLPAIKSLCEVRVIAELMRSYRGVSCIWCKAPIPVSARIAGLQDEPAYKRTNAPQSFPAPAASCASTKTYTPSPMFKCLTESHERDVREPERLECSRLTAQKPKAILMLANGYVPRASVRVLFLFEAFKHQIQFGVEPVVQRLAFLAAARQI